MTEEEEKELDFNNLEDVKKKLKELSENYKSLTDDFLKKSFQLSLCREQINYCLELIALLESEND